MAHLVKSLVLAAGSFILVATGPSGLSSAAAAADNATAAPVRVTGTDRRLCLLAPVNGMERVQLPACERVLSAPMRENDPWDTRARALHNQAFYLVVLGEQRRALEALDESDQIGRARNDPFFNRSIAVGNAMLRAIALDRSNRSADAHAAIAAIRSARPHSMVVAIALDRIGTSIDNDLNAYIQNLEARIPTMPNNLRLLFNIYILQGEWDKAAAIADQVSLEDPKPIGGWSIEGSSGAEGQLDELISLDMERAYVFSALSQSARAQSQIDHAAAEIVEFVGPAPQPQPGRPISRGRMTEYQNRQSAGEKATRVITLWRDAIELREKAVGGAPTEEILNDENRRFRELPIWLDILRSVKLDNDEDKSMRDRALSRVFNDMSREITQIENNQIAELLPEPESAENHPNFNRAGDGILLHRERGYSQAPERAGEFRTIRFGTQSGSLATADELGLLAVATYAQREGKDSFILISRRAIKRTTHVTGYFGGTSDVDSGNESQALVVFLDSSALPPEWESSRYRLIMVQDVLDSIGAQQRELEALRAARRAQRR